MNYLRDGILTVTILALILILDNKPRPVKVSEQAPHCVIEYKTARKNIFGEWETGWARGYGPCTLQDKYFQI